MTVRQIYVRISVSLPEQTDGYEYEVLETIECIKKGLRGKKGELRK